MSNHKEIDTTCPECGGDGEVYYSCCGDDVKNTMAEDIGLCPTCHEHLDGERMTCSTCDGLGYIPESEVELNAELEKGDEANDSIKENQ
jgi:DnaJ-class molecular chaperone